LSMFGTASCETALSSGRTMIGRSKTTFGEPLTKSGTACQTSSHSRKYLGTKELFLQLSEEEAWELSFQHSNHSWSFAPC
jgi:hypothetical protein